MAHEYPQKYWWLVLIVVPVVVAIISVIPRAPDGSVTPRAPDDKSTITRINVIPRQVTLQVGKTAGLSAEARTSSGAAYPGIQPQWASIDPTIASVTPAGMLTALKEGNTQVIAKANGLMGAAYIMVTAPTPSAPIPPSLQPISPPSRPVPPPEAGPTVPPPSQSDSAAKNRAEVLKLTGVGIDYMRRADLSFVFSHAQLPFFFAGLMIGTRDLLDSVLTESVTSVRMFVESADLVKLTAYPVHDLRSRDWFPKVSSVIPIPIEDSDWAALIATRIEKQPSGFVTWVAFFRSGEGAWKLVGVSGGEGVLE
jgi:hypothetical protein